MKDKLNLEKFSELVQLKSVEFKISKTWFQLSTERLQHIKNRHLIWWSDYVSWESSYFFTEESITPLLNNIDLSWVVTAKGDKYSITKIYQDIIWFDRISWDTKLVTVIFDKNWNIITAHPGLPTN
jgi:hypothetical protein